jgi:hypothetical protein
VFTDVILNPSLSFSLLAVLRKSDYNKKSRNPSWTNGHGRVFGAIVLGLIIAAGISRAK